MLWPSASTRVARKGLALIDLIRQHGIRHDTRLVHIGYARVAISNSKGQAEGSMRPPFCIFWLALAWLITSSAQAHSRGFAWFFAHSRPHGTCSGQHVVATFYASGGRTASGQTFDPGGYTAAHRTLPFGSRVTVTNPQNGRSVTGVINDRGPFTRGGTLDLSRAAARAIR